MFEACAARHNFVASRDLLSRAGLKLLAVKLFERNYSGLTSRRRAAKNNCRTDNVRVFGQLDSVKHARDPDDGFFVWIELLEGLRHFDAVDSNTGYGGHARH